MSVFLKGIWQVNIEFSLLLLAILVMRYVVRKTTRNYNAYLLWLSIPLALVGGVLMSLARFSEPPVAVASVMVRSYLVEPVQSIDYWAYIAYGWLALAPIFLARLLIQHAKLRRDLRSIAIDAAHGLKSSYPIVLIDKLDFSPAVYGFWKPKIYFPIQLMDELSTEQVSLIIKHEEHHIKQQHLWLNLLWDVAVCCLWFNPLIYIARQGFRHDQELFCDYLVLNKSSDGDQESYGLALLTTVSATHSVSLLCSWKAFNQLEERIMNIKRPNNKVGKLLLLSCGLCIVGATSLYAAGPEESASLPLKFSVESFTGQPSSSAIALLGHMPVENIKCGYRQGEDGPTVLIESRECSITEKGVKRDLTGDEKAAYLAHLKQSYSESLSASSEKSEFEFTKSGEFNEQKMRAMYKSQGVPDDKVEELIEHTRDHLKNVLDQYY